MEIPSLRQLQRSIKLTERIEKLQAELASVFSGISKAIEPKAKKSKARKRKNARVQKAKLANPAPAGPTAPIVKPKKKRKMSAAGKARIVAAQKARWAKIKGATALGTVPSDSKPSDEKTKPAPKRKAKKSRKPAKK